MRGVKSQDRKQTQNFGSSLIFKVCEIPNAKIGMGEFAIRKKRNKQTKLN